MQHRAHFRPFSLEVSALYCSYYAALTSAVSWDLHVTSSCHRIKIYSMNRTRPATKARLEAYAARGESVLPITKPVEWSLEDMDDFVERIRKNPREPRSDF